jgi:hypothetical protein
MAVVSTVRLSELEGAQRVDAEYYQPQYLRLVGELRKLGAVPLERFCHFVKKGIFDLSPRYYVDSGIPLIRTTEIKSEIADMSSVVFLSEDTHGRHKETELESADIVFTKIGANIGDSAILPRRHRRYNFSQNVAGAKIRKAVIAPYYLAAYLNSKFGRLQLRRAEMPSGQGKLELTDIKRILIVVADSGLQRCVEEFYLHAEDEIQKSSQLYSQAENLLLEELGLKDFKPKYELSYSANLSKAFGAHRVDAEYFQPAYDQVTEKVTSYKNGYTTLLSTAEPVRADFDPGRYPDNSFRYVELADIDTSIGIIHVASDIKGEEAPSRARRILERGDVIVSRVEGSLEKVALVDEEYDGSLASTGFFQFRVKETHPEVFLVLAKSSVLEAQLKRECTGTILTAVPNESLKRVVVPILPPDVQQEITSFVCQSHEARKKAKELLEEAKRKVEEMIEEA